MDARVTAVDVRLASGSIYVDPDHLPHSPDDKIVAVNGPGFDFVMFSHEARALAEALIVAADAADAAEAVDKKNALAAGGNQREGENQNPTKGTRFMNQTTPSNDVTASTLLRIAEASGMRPSDLLGWNVPAWADHASIEIDGEELTNTFRRHVDGESATIVTAEQIDWMTAVGEQKSSRPDIVIRTEPNGPAQFTFTPRDGDHVRAIAEALQELAFIWDAEVTK